MCLGPAVLEVAHPTSAESLLTRILHPDTTRSSRFVLQVLSSAPRPVEQSLFCGSRGCVQNMGRGFGDLLSGRPRLSPAFFIPGIDER